MIGDDDEPLVEYSAPEDARRTDVAGPDTGIRMTESDSYERMIDGMRRASEGARCLACYIDRDGFDLLASTLDKLRFGMVRLAARPRPNDADSTHPKHVTRQTRIEGYNQLFEGLRDAAACARQFGTGHRGHLQWTLVAGRLDELRDKAGELVRRRTKTSPFLIT